MASPSLEDIVQDLEDEHRSLAQVLRSCAEKQWHFQTASPGWQVRHQISHLEFFDQRAILALTSPDAFAADRRQIMAAAPEDPSVAQAESASSRELLASWLWNSARLVEIGRHAEPGVRVPWYGPSMSLKSFLTARLMECWAHGEDVAAAIGSQRQPTARLRHIAHIGVATREFCLSINQLPADDSRIAIRLQSPEGELWEWASGNQVSPDEEQLITGDALDFCRVVTQRCSIEESSLTVKGMGAQTWMSVAQAFAGPPSGPKRV